MDLDDWYPDMTREQRQVVIALCLDKGSTLEEVRQGLRTYEATKAREEVVLYLSQMEWPWVYIEDYLFMNESAVWSMMKLIERRRKVRQDLRMDPIREEIFAC